VTIFPHVKRSTVAPRAAEPESDAAFRELVAIREIVRAFLTAERAEDVYQFALARVCPLVGATFASVYLVDGASELMRLAAAYNWPERFQPFLGDMRVRLGFGPSGQAAAERRTIQIPDVFADNALEDWQEVASEMGFRALVAVPLQSGSHVLGTLTFYFSSADSLIDERRALMRTVADQLAATAEKALLIEQLRRANTALVTSNAELERQYAALVEARRVKEEFLSNVSHELRTPLTAAMGYIALMLEEVAGPLTPEQRQELSHVRVATERLLALVDDLMALTTLKRGGLDLDLSAFDPREPLRQAVATVAGRADAVLLRIDEPPTPLPPMRSDVRKIIKILSVLLSNAYKFTPRGEVRAGVSVDGRGVRYRIADTGIGIAPEFHEDVFEEFRQLDGSTTRRYGGSGLGLALARRFARHLGGEIRLVSFAGAGAEFIVELPLTLDQGAAAESPARGGDVRGPQPISPVGIHIS
jgi:signal transduction histidine kinase